MPYFRVLLPVMLMLAAPHRLGAQSLVGQPLSPETTGTPKSEPLPAPQSDEELEAVQSQITADLASDLLEVQKLIKASRQPDFSEGKKVKLAALEALIESLKSCDVLLKELDDLRLQVKGLEDEASSSKLVEELADFQKTVDDVQNETTARRAGVTADQLRQAEQDLDTIRTNLNSRVKAQEERAQRKAELAGRQDPLKAEVASALVAWTNAQAEFEAKAATLAEDTPERSAAEFQRDKVRHDASVTLWRQAKLEWETKRDTLLTDQAEQRNSALRQLVASHEKRVERFQQLRTRSQIEMAREEAERAKAQGDQVTPYELSFLDLKLRMLERKQELADLQRTLGTKDRFTAADLDTLKQDLAAESEAWAPMMEVLDRKTGEKIKTYYQRIGGTERARRVEHDRLQNLYDNSLDDRVRITDRIDEIVDDELRTGLRNLAALERAEGNGEAAARFTPQIKEFREQLAEHFDSARKGLDELVNRLAEANQLLTAHVDHLTAQRSRLYWFYLRVQDHPLWKYRLETSRGEWLAESDKRTAVQSSIRAGADSVGTTSALIITALLLATMGASWLARRRLLAYADGLEKSVAVGLAESEQTIAPLSDRLHLQLIRFAGRIAPIVAPTAVAGIWIRAFSPLDGRLAGTIMLMLIVSGILAGLISTLFSRSKPRYRLVPCSNVVAAHYRRWMRILLYASMLLAPVPILLTVLDWAPFTRNYLWSGYKILALITVLGFAFPRQTVLRVVGRPENLRYRLTFLAVASGYPMLYLGVVALLVLQFCGFGPLVSYVLAGSAQSTLAVVLAVLFVRYLRDVVLKLGQQLSPTRDGAPDLDATVAAEHAEALQAGREATLLDRRFEQLDEQLWIGMLLSLFRWAVGILTAVLILGFWGVNRVDLRLALDYAVLAGAENRPPITVGRGLAAVTVVVLIWVFSRAIRAFLEARVFPTYSALDRGGRAAVSTLLHYTLVFLGLYFALFILQIPLGALTVVLGTLGLGLGLGLQPVFVNFLSGIIILFERHVKVGDLIEVGGVLGEVSSVSLRATSIKTYDNVDMIIPNADFVNGAVINWTMNDPRIRGKVDVGVSYQNDPRLVERLLLQVAKDCPYVLKDPPPRVRFTNFGDNSLNFVLFAWFHNAADRLDFMTDSRYRIVELFRANGVEIPYPQRTLSLQGDRPLRVQIDSESAARAEERRHGPPVEKPLGKRLH